MSVNALLKPRSIEVETAEGNPYSATVTMEPFETGYAHTLGNALRRVLLSSMVGFAPTEAQIAGVVHEYSQIDGVKEDVVDILLNVKGIIFKLENRDEVTITLRKEGEGRHCRGLRSAARCSDSQSGTCHCQPFRRQA